MYEIIQGKVTLNDQDFLYVEGKGMPGVRYVNLTGSPVHAQNIRKSQIVEEKVSIVIPPATEFPASIEDKGVVGLPSPSLSNEAIYYIVSEDVFNFVKRDDLCTEVWLEIDYKLATILVPIKPW